MLFLSIMHHYLLWHYTRAFKEIFHVWLNFIWFVFHFFSIAELLRSWFSPWKRMVEDRGETWNLEDLAGYVIIGFLSRVVGFIMRTTVLITGFSALLFVILAGFITYIFWIVAPVAIVGSLITGIGYVAASFFNKYL